MVAKKSSAKTPTKKTRAQKELPAKKTPGKTKLVTTKPAKTKPAKTTPQKAALTGATTSGSRPRGGPSEDPVGTLVVEGSVVNFVLQDQSRTLEQLRYEGQAIALEIDIAALTPDQLSKLETFVSAPQDDEARAITWRPRPPPPPPPPSP